MFQTNPILALLMRKRAALRFLVELIFDIHFSNNYQTKYNENVFFLLSSEEKQFVIHHRWFSPVVTAQLENIRGKAVLN